MPLKRMFLSNFLNTVNIYERLTTNLCIYYVLPKHHKNKDPKVNDVLKHGRVQVPNDRFVEKQNAVYT